MNITDEGLREYIEVFIATLQETAERYIRPPLRDNLFHLSLLPAFITGYVSTQYGVAIEYGPPTPVAPERTVIEIKRGSARIEDLLVQAPNFLRGRGPAISISQTKSVHMKGQTIEWLFPFRISGPEISVFVEDMKISAGPWNRFITYAEVFGNREHNTWSREQAITRANDEVLAALDEIRRSEEKGLSITDYVSIYKRQTILLLGDYSATGEERLSTISSILSELGYEPLLVKDVPDIPGYDLRQKVVALGAVSRFVVIDDSSKSGHLTEVEICGQNNWVTILLRAGGQGGSYMTAGGSHFSKVILEKDYATSDPKPAIMEATDWAEAKLEELEHALAATYPWRNVDS